MPKLKSRLAHESLNSKERQHYLRIAQMATRLGCKNLQKYFGKVKNITAKSKSNFVSEADLSTEKLIRDFLKKKSPDIDFLGEETSFLNKTTGFEKSTTSARWILDPLDGTTNFINGLPLFCISLALEVHGVIEVAVIDVPMLKQTFTATRDGGAFVNKTPIHVRPLSKLDQAFLVTGFVNQSRSVLAKQLKIFNQLVWKVDAVRRSGSAAFDLAHVACGVFHGYWEENVQPWDVAAGLLLVQEAGGSIVRYDGGPAQQYDRQFIAGSSSLIKKVLPFFKSHQKIRI